MPKQTVLVIPSSSAPMRVKTRPYFEDRRLAPLAKIPYHLVHVRQAPPPLSHAAQGPATASGPSEPIIVDADQDTKEEQDENHKHFLWEDE